MKEGGYKIDDSAEKIEEKKPDAGGPKATG